MVGAAAGAALGAWVAGSLTNRGRGAGEGTARQRIHQLLGRTLTDWVVTDEDAAAALGILLAVEKSDPVELYEVVQAMRIGDDWETLRTQLPGDLQESLWALVQLRMSPDSGYVMPGDALRLTFLSKRGVPKRVQTPGGQSITDPKDVRELEVQGRAVGLIDLRTRLDVAGLSLEAAAGKIAQAYVDAGWFGQLRVILEPLRRGSLYASLGTLSTPTKAEGASRPLDPVAQARKTKLDRFRDHVLGTSFGMPVLDMAVSLYHREVDEHLDQYDDPEQLWVQSKARAQTRYEQLTKPTPAEEFLAFSRREMARTVTMPAPQKATYDKTNSRFIAWLSKHEKDPRLATTQPVEVWTREYMVVVRGEVAGQVKKEMDAAAQKRRDVALERGSEKFGEALKLAERRVWPVTPTSSASSSEEFISETTGEVVTKSWLITASPAERLMRDKIATDFLHSSMERLVRDPEAYLKTDVTTDLVDYLRQNPEQLAALQLTVEHPVVEKLRGRGRHPGLADRRGGGRRVHPVRRCRRRDHRGPVGAGPPRAPAVDDRAHDRGRRSRAAGHLQGAQAGQGGLCREQGGQGLRARGSRGRAGLPDVHRARPQPRGASSSAGAWTRSRPVAGSRTPRCCARWRACSRARHDRQGGRQGLDARGRAGDRGGRGAGAAGREAARPAR